LRLFFVRVKLHVIEYYDTLHYLYTTIDTSRKIGVLTDSEAIKSLNMIHKGKYEFKFLNEKLFSSYVGLQQNPTYFLSETFNNQIPALLENGLINFWISCFYTQYDHKFETGPAVLTLKQLSIGFQLFLFMLFISVICFVGEFGTTIKMYIVYISMLKTYFVYSKLVHWKQMQNTDIRKVL
jgi:hypothetical protein